MTALREAAALAAEASRPYPNDSDVYSRARTALLAAIEGAKAYPKATADAQVGLGEKDGAGIGSPPLTDRLRRRQCIEQHGRARRDLADDGQARHSSPLRIPASFSSA